MRILFAKRWVDRGVEKIVISYQIGSLIRGFCMPYKEFVKRYG